MVNIMVCKVVSTCLNQDFQDKRMAGIANANALLLTELYACFRMAFDVSFSYPSYPYNPVYPGSDKFQNLYTPQFYVFTC